MLYVDDNAQNHKYTNEWDGMEPVPQKKQHHNRCDGDTQCEDIELQKSLFYAVQRIC